MQHDDEITKSDASDVEDVRLIEKVEAEAAIQSGQVLSRRNKQPPTSSGVQQSLSGVGAMDAVARFPRSTTDFGRAAAETQSVIDLRAAEVGSTEVGFKGPGHKKARAPKIVAGEHQAIHEESPRQDALIDLEMTAVDDDGQNVAERDNGGRSNVDRNGAGLKGSAGSGSEPENQNQTGEDLGEPQLLHWTDPPTGEVPATLASDHALRAKGPSWFDERSIKESDLADLTDLGKASRLGAMKEQEITEQEEGNSPLSSGHPETKRSKRNKRRRTGRNIDQDQDQEAGGELHDGANGTHAQQNDEKKIVGANVSVLTSPSFTRRVVTGVVVAATALVAFAAGPLFALALVAVVLLLSAMELYDGFRRVGYKPATLLALVAVMGMVFGSYARGPQAIPLVLMLAALFTFFWYLARVIKENPTANIAVTILGIVWVGVLGSYAALLLRAPDRHGIAFLVAAVVMTAAYDVGAYLGGNFFGKHPMAPTISPNKTWEGLVAGTAASLLIGTAVVQLVHPWGVVEAVVLAALVSCVAPLGDLAESMVKRDLGLKDMGRLLPGHGGAMDRFDSLLFVLPATYYLVQFFDLI